MTVLSENIESDTCEVEGSCDVGVSTCNHVCSTPTDHGAPKRDRLLEMLALPKEELSEEEYTKIVEFLCSNSEHWTNQS